MKKASLVLSLLSVILGFTGVVYMSQGLFAQSFMDLGMEYKFELGKSRLDISRLGKGKISDFHPWWVKIGKSLGFVMEPHNFLPEERETHAISVLSGFIFIAAGTLLQGFGLLVESLPKRKPRTKN